MQGKKNQVTFKTCDKYTCTPKGRNLNWVKSFAEEKCCHFDNAGSPIGTNMLSVQLPDNCTSVSVMCRKKEGYADIQMESDNSQCPKKPRKIFFKQSYKHLMIWLQLSCM